MKAALSLPIFFSTNAAKQQNFRWLRITDHDWLHVFARAMDLNLKMIFFPLSAAVLKKDASLIAHQLTSSITLGRADSSEKQPAVLDLHGRGYNLAPCCTPVPEDPIQGHFIKATNTVHIHRSDCSHCQRGYRVNPENWQEMSLEPNLQKKLFSAKLDAEITETHATLEKITGQIAKAQSSISGFSLTELSPTASKVTLTIQIQRRQASAEDHQCSSRFIPAVKTC